MYPVCEKILVENNGERRCKNLGKKQFWKVEHAELFLEKYNSIFGWISRFHFYERFIFKGNTQFFKKVTFEPLMDSKPNHYGSCNQYYKSCYF